MKLVTYKTDSSPHLGALLGDQIINLAQAYQALNSDADEAFPDDLLSLLTAGEAGLAKAQTVVEAATRSEEWQVALADVTLLPPILRPGKIICLGRNYAEHAREGGAEPLEYPIIFFKPASALLGDGDTIVIPPVTEKADYEAELAVVIGRPCKQVSAQAALDYVAGYTVANDVSARDLQRRTPQWAVGKMLDTFCPLGPALVTHDEVPNPNDLDIRTTLNGEVMQNSNTCMMIFDVPYIINYLSQIATLEPGDIILTGTPEGVGFARNPPVYLQSGDVISVEVENVGVLTNTVQTM